MTSPAMAQTPGTNSTTGTQPGAGTAPSNQPGTNNAQMSQAGSGSEETLPPSELRRVQQELKSQNLYNGRIDGRWGPETQAAVTQFQQNHQLQATGQLDQQTLQAMNLGPSRRTATRQTGARTTGAGAGTGANGTGAPLGTNTGGAGSGANTGTGSGGTPSR